MTVSVIALAALLGMAGVAEAAGAHKPFVISVDGVAIDGSGAVTDAGRRTDVALAATDIQMKFDGLGVSPLLNVTTVPLRRAFRPGETVRFSASLNYQAFVVRSELRLYDLAGKRKDLPYKVLDVAADGMASWKMPEDAPQDMAYVLRVYDRDGRFDETIPLPLSRLASLAADTADASASAAPGLGDDRTAIRNIPVSGGAVTVYGARVPAGHEVRAFGAAVPVDRDGAFVIQRILPPGPHAIDVSVLRQGKGLWFSRDIDIPRQDWFYVALADLTAGWRFGGHHMEEVRPGEFDPTYTRGRLAFYLKGKIRGEYLLTAAADTGDGRIENLFKGLDAKDPRQYLKRIDPQDYYPVYGDDSSAVEDAPTRGKFYVRLANGPSHVMWGNFRSNITGTEFLKSNRALYGASGVYRGRQVTADGEARTAADLYAAQPGTLPQHDVFRATGGSAYFLKYRDITPGSETIVIETRNATTGWVISRHTLSEGDDYELDDVQGVLLLKAPVASTGASGSENFVVADYEFTPAAGEAGGYVLGGRATQWLGDHVRVGATGMTDKTGKADQKLYGADIRLQASSRTYVEGEVARSSGPGFGAAYSADGGLSLQDWPTAGDVSRQATAWRVETRGDLDELTRGAMKGHVGARYETAAKGFSTRDLDVRHGRRAFGGDADVELSDTLAAAASYSELRADGGGVDREGLAKVRKNLTDHVSIEPFGRYTEKNRAAASGDDSGRRGDLGLRGGYAWDERTELYAFGQATVARSAMRDRDHRAGVGGKRQLTEKVDIAAEASFGSLGPAGSATLGYAPTADDRYYIGYRLDAERASAASWPYDLSGRDLGSVVAGARRRISEEWSAYGEDNYDMFGARRSLTQAYGVTYTPDARWTIGGGAEVGHVFDDTVDPATGRKNPDFDREAVSLSAVYRDDAGIDAKAKGELRFDNSEDSARDVASYLASLALGYKVSDDWRTLASLDAVISDATDSTRDGDYVEGSLGLAWRPAANDRLNALAKYTFLYDRPGADQVSVDGTTDGPLQLSHIAAIDATYDLTPKLTVGGKYGVRIGEQKDRDAGSDWTSAVVQLGVLRADLHVVHGWDALIEGRALWNTDAGTVDTGILAAVYRHLGDNMKIGVGYNFGVFSDDLRDLVHDDQGVFVNLIGKL